MSQEHGSVPAGLGSGDWASVPEARGPSSTLSTVFGDDPGLWPLSFQEAPPTSVPYSCAAYMGSELRPGKNRPDFLFDIPARLGERICEQGGRGPAYHPPAPVWPGCGALAIPWDPTMSSWPWWLS